MPALHEILRRCAGRGQNFPDPLVIVHRLAAFVVTLVHIMAIG